MRAADAARALLRSVDLRFESAAEERAFVADGVRHRCSHSVVAGGFTAVLIAATEVRRALLEFDREEDPMRWGVWDGRWVRILYATSVVALVLSMSVLAACRLRWKSCRWGGSELQVAVQYIAVCAFATLLRRCGIAKMMQTPDAAWGTCNDSVADTNTVLAVDTCVTSLCLSGALRFHRLSVFVFFSWCSWCASEVVQMQRVTGFSSSTMLILLTLCVLALLGAWRQEQFVRSQWRQRQTIEEQGEKLSERSATACGMQAVAERFCASVLSVRDDFRVCVEDVSVSALLGHSTLGRSLLDFVEPTDRGRLAAALAQAASANAPVCLQVTLSGEGSREASLLIADTGGRSPKYIVGVTIEDSEPQHVEGKGPAIEADCFTDLPPDEEVESSMTAQIFHRMSLRRVARLACDEHWRIPAEDLRLPLPACLLGRGGFGVVAAAELQGQSVAVKAVPSSADDVRQLSALLNEFRVLRRVRHPNVVLFFGAVIEPGARSVALVYELIHGMQLDRAMARMAPSRLCRYRMLHDVSSALRYLHSQEPAIVHSDLKGGNVMVEELRSGLRAKIIDFGLSRFLAAGKAGAGGGSLGWSPPEKFLQRGGACCTAADAFSFGWLARLVVSGEGPHGGLQGMALARAVWRMVSDKSAPAVDLPEAAPWREECEALCRACLAFDPASRPNMEKVQEMLKGWLSLEDAVELGFARAATSVGSVAWLEGEVELRNAAEGDGEEFAVQLELDVADGCRVVRRDGSPPSAYPEVGERFVDWVDRPADFRQVVLSTLTDIRSGLAEAPLERLLAGLTLQPPGEGGPRTPRRVCGSVIFADGAGGVTLRLRERT